MNSEEKVGASSMFLQSLRVGRGQGGAVTVHWDFDYKWSILDELLFEVVIRIRFFFIGHRWETDESASEGNVIISS